MTTQLATAISIARGCFRTHRVRILQTASTPHKGAAWPLTKTNVVFFEALLAKYCGSRLRNSETGAHTSGHTIYSGLLTWLVSMAWISELPRASIE